MIWTELNGEADNWVLKINNKVISFHKTYVKIVSNHQFSDTIVFEKVKKTVNQSFEMNQTIKGHNFLEMIYLCTSIYLL